MGLNELSDMTFAEFQKINSPPPFTIQHTEILFNHEYFQYEYNSSFKVPSAFDWRNYNVVTSVKNQGLCGSCYAFASIAAVESYLLIKTKKYYDLSEQEIVDCAGHYDTGKIIIKKIYIFK
jgi:C1A family cysteine protease